MTTPKINTVVTQTRAGDELAIKAISQWSEVAPKIYVCGPTKPVQAFGVRYLGADPKSLRWLLAAYMGTMPGGEVLAVLSPDVTISKDQTKLFDEIQRQRIGMAWAAHVDIKGLPKAFLMASAVAAHILMQIPNTISVTDQNWSTWMDEWLSKYMMKPRYINATEYGVISALAQPEPKEPEVLNAYVVSLTQPQPTTDPKPVKRVIGVPFKKKPSKQLQDVGSNPSNVDKAGGQPAGI